MASEVVNGGIRLGGMKVAPATFVEHIRTVQCETCCGWGHIGAHCPVAAGKWCGLCAGNHIAEHQCNIAECRVTKGKACSNLVPRCVNCGGDHIAFSPKCTHKKAAGKRASGGYGGPMTVLQHNCAGVGQVVVGAVRVGWRLEPT